MRAQRATLHRRVVVAARIDASEAMLNLEREGIDLAIRLNAQPPGPGDPRPLLRERLMLVAAPAIAARITEPRHMLDAPLLVFHDPGARFAWMSWTQWYQRLGLARSSKQACLYFSQYAHVLNAAVQQAGIAIGRTPMVLPMLKSGQLQVVLPEHAVDGLTYQIVAADTERPGVRQFRAWLEGELAGEVIG
ncbi:LysR substrate-binding domain-containing protein [Cupriavidus sp. WS]|uniref:LysR substrate-binding domain-containing protein n=1 Tax=Cupriavidus sp. WS TaxID=1312922 RepID=UPI001E577F53|nr:LysR substrate-binding domain-containing protein [Cupriavidus sp. WS]